MSREGLSLIPLAARLPCVQKCLKLLKSFFSGMSQQRHGQHILPGPEKGEKSASPEAQRTCISPLLILRMLPGACARMSTSKCKGVNAQMCLTWENTLDKGNESW